MHEKSALLNVVEVVGTVAKHAQLERSHLDSPGNTKGGYGGA